MIKSFKYAFFKTIPILFSYVFLGIAFGILMHDAKLSILWSGLLSTIVYTGAFQLAFVGLYKGGATLITYTLTALALGSRHIFYGFSFLEEFRANKKSFPYMIFSLTDETYALDCQVKEEPENIYSDKQIKKSQVYLFIGILCQLYWITGSILGGVIGTLIPFDFTGIDFCMTALFVTVFIEQWIAATKEEGGYLKNHAPAVIGMVCAIFFFVWLGADGFLLPSLASASTILLMLSLTEKGGRGNE